MDGSSHPELPRAAQRLRPQRSRGSSLFPFRRPRRPPWWSRRSHAGRVHRIRPCARRPARRPRARDDRRPRLTCAPTTPPPAAAGRRGRARPQPPRVRLDPAARPHQAPSRPWRSPIEAHADRRRARLPARRSARAARLRPRSTSPTRATSTRSTATGAPTTSPRPPTRTVVAARSSRTPSPAGSIPGRAASTRSSPRSPPSPHGSATPTRRGRRIDDEVGWYEDVAGVVVDVAGDVVGPGGDVRAVPVRVRASRMAGDPLQTIWDVATGTVLVEQVAAAEAILVEDGELYTDDDGRCGDAGRVHHRRPPAARRRRPRRSGTPSSIADDDPSDRLVRHEMQHVDDIETVGAGVVLHDLRRPLRVRTWPARSTTCIDGESLDDARDDAYHDIIWEQRADAAEDRGPAEPLCVTQSTAIGDVRGDTDDGDGRRHGIRRRARTSPCTGAPRRARRGRRPRRWPSSSGRGRGSRGRRRS